MEEKAVTFIAEISGLILVLGTFFTAIFQAKNNTEKNLLEQIKVMNERIEEQDKRIREISDERDTERKEREKIMELYENEKAARTRLERQVHELKRKLK